MRRQWSITSLRWPGAGSRRSPGPVLDQRVDRRHDWAGPGWRADPTVATGRRLMLDQQSSDHGRAGRESAGERSRCLARPAVGPAAALRELGMVRGSTDRTGATLTSRHQRLTRLPRHPNPLTSPRERGQLRRYRPRRLRDVARSASAAVMDSIEDRQVCLASRYEEWPPELA